MRALYLAWKHTGGRMDPYRTAHVLDEGYRPLGDPEAAPRPPENHRRIRNVLLGFAAVAEDEMLALHAPR
jgi:hypothetical protein